MKRYYIDHAATTPIRPDVMEVMVDAMQQAWGNPSSIHFAGRNARKELDEARRMVAKCWDVLPSEIVWTSGGTEADNLAIFGCTDALRDYGNHCITTKIEHHAVLHAFHKLEENGFDVTYLDVNEEGLVSVDDFKQALRDDTTFVSIMTGNNEVGTVQPIEEIASVLKDHRAVFHTDAVQTIGSLLFSPKAYGVDLCSVSSHKFGGPKGVGFLYVKEGTPFRSQQLGGEQERKRRAGTENIPGIVGLTHAFRVATENQPHHAEKMKALIETFLRTLQQNDVTFVRNGAHDQTRSLPHIVNLHFPGMSLEKMLMNLDLDGVAASSGSACSAGSVQPSHVLKAMYGDDPRTKESIRFSVGAGLTEEDMVEIGTIVARIVDRLSVK